MCLPGADFLCDSIDAAAAATAQKFLEELARAASEAAGEMLRALVAGWLSVPSPDMSQESGTVAFLRGYTHWAVAAIAVGAVLVAAIRLAWERNGREAGSLARGLVTMVVLTGAGVPAVQLLTAIGDSYSDWILDKAADGDLGARLLLLMPVGTTFGGLPALAVIGVAALMFLTTMVQLLMLLARGAGLVLLAGLLPLAGSVGIAGSGRAIRDRYLTWLLALVLYKPAAATVYAAVFWMLGHGRDLTTLLTGLVMFCMAIVAMPALMRLIAPAVSVLSSGGGSGGVAAAGVSGVAQLASGAVRIGSSGGGGSGGGQAGGGAGMPGGASPSAPMPGPRPSGGAGASGGGGAAAGAGGGAGSGAGAAGPGAASTAGAGAGAGTAGAGAGTGAGAASAGAGAGAGAGAAAAGGPVGLAVAAGVMAAKAGPATVRKVGGTASGAVDGQG